MIDEKIVSQQSKMHHQTQQLTSQGQTSITRNTLRKAIQQSTLLVKHSMFGTSSNVQKEVRNKVHTFVTVNKNSNSSRLKVKDCAHEKAIRRKLMKRRNSTRSIRTLTRYLRLNRPKTTKSNGSKKTREKICSGCVGGFFNDCTN